MREYVKHSKLYMIAKRPRLYFSEPKINEHKMRLDFVLRQAVTNYRASFRLHLKDLLPNYANISVDVKTGDKVIKLVETGKDDEEPLVWFTPDKLLFDNWRGHIRNVGLRYARKLSTFDLLYVGISKEGDSLNRLFSQGHIKRSKILSQEEQSEPSGFLTEEIMIFLFNVVPRRVRIFDSSEIHLAADAPRPIEGNRLVVTPRRFHPRIADEVHEIRYADYPRGLDASMTRGLRDTSTGLPRTSRFARRKRPSSGKLMSPSEHR